MILETVENKVLYHIQQGEVPPGGHTWEIGRKDYWGKEINFVLKTAFEKNDNNYMMNIQTGEPVNSLQVFRDMYLALLDQATKPDCSNFIRANIDSILDLYIKMYVSLHNHIYNLREYVFEEVRKEVNPELPSRFTGLWVAPAEDLDFWWHVLTPQETNTIIKLKLNGKIFKGNSDFQPLKTLSIMEMRDYARQYWNSSAGYMPENRYEYLFEGESEVLEVLQPEEFGLKNPKTINGFPIIGTY